MTDREKVIVGLKKLHENSGCMMVYECDCKTCPYECVNGCCGQIIDDAIVLLKAQEPRVMTLVELEDWDGAVFFEAYETDMYYALIEDIEFMAGMSGGYTFVNVEPGEHHRRVWDGFDYGSIWRCWTSRPTDEQREVIQWRNT